MTDGGSQSVIFLSKTTQTLPKLLFAINERTNKAAH